jgi:hypothetical protein
MALFGRGRCTSRQVHFPGPETETNPETETETGAAGRLSASHERSRYASRCIGSHVSDEMGSSWVVDTGRSACRANRSSCVGTAASLPKHGGMSAQPTSNSTERDAEKGNRGQLKAHLSSEPMTIKIRCSISSDTPLASDDEAKLVRLPDEVIDIISRSMSGAR